MKSSVPKKFPKEGKKQTTTTPREEADAAVEEALKENLGNMDAITKDLRTGAAFTTLRQKRRQRKKTIFEFTDSGGLLPEVASQPTSVPAGSSGGLAQQPRFSERTDSAGRRLDEKTNRRKARAKLLRQCSILVKK
mmetsp:Transcript_8167/g.10905  ORF Transcript_8167/g.10905 Transcript_8167/m.10905 type:complete len:136 (+) Transcript_8167:701-1108(+)